MGETTGGGVHPGGTRTVEGCISVLIPDGRAINPITGTSWEGTGVKPHIEAPAGEAPEVALTEARERLREARSSD